MRNCLVMGTGRSGTSMVAGSLAAAGYFMGGRLMPPTGSNPRGYFESYEIEKINEAILARVLPRRPPRPFRRFLADRPRRAQRWLARLEVDAEIRARRGTDRRMACLVAHVPYCFKDPRFCYTLPAWRPHLENTRFLCIFRSPSVTATSILKDREDSPYLHDLKLDFEEAVEVWTLMYRHVLERHASEGDWLFLHYDQVLAGDGLDRIGRFLGATVDAAFPDVSLRRSRGGRAVPGEPDRIYRSLCRRAGYEEGSD